MADTVPEPWYSAMEKRNIGRPNGQGTPSFRALARASGVATQTVIRVVDGTENPTQDTIQALADALGVDVRTVAEWAGQAREIRAPFEPPHEAHLMTHRERTAVIQVIRLFTEGRGRGEVREDEPVVVPEVVTRVRPLRSVPPDPVKQAARPRKRKPVAGVEPDGASG